MFLHGAPSELREPGTYPPDRAQTEPLPVLADGRRRTGNGHSRAKRLRLPALIVTMTLVVTASVAWRVIAQSPTTEARKDRTPEASGDFVVEVRAGDSALAIGRRLADLGVLESDSAFADAARSQTPSGTFEPGFYVVATGGEAADVVRQFVDPARRVGLVVVAAGRRLDDVTDAATGQVSEGLLGSISRASCVPSNGRRRCLTVADLRRAAALASAEQLMVPEWARERVTSLTGDHRRLEGLISVGQWSFDPTDSPTQALATLISASAMRYDHNAVLRTAAEELGMTPYQLLIVASIVQQEGRPADYSRIAADIYDRLRQGVRLQRQSTRQYSQATGLDSRGGDRLSPWDTVEIVGLPATPISVPSEQAIAVAQHP